jgi:hypothetical protein
VSAITTTTDCVLKRQVTYCNWVHPGDRSPQTFDTLTVEDFRRAVENGSLFFRKLRAPARRPRRAQQQQGQQPGQAELHLGGKRQLDDSLLEKKKKIETETDTGKAKIEITTATAGHTSSVDAGTVKDAEAVAEAVAPAAAAATPEEDTYYDDLLERWATFVLGTESKYSNDNGNGSTTTQQGKSDLTASRARDGAASQPPQEGEGENGAKDDDKDASTVAEQPFKDQELEFSLADCLRRLRLIQAERDLPSQASTDRNRDRYNNSNNSNNSNSSNGSGGSGAYRHIYNNQSEGGSNRDRASGNHRYRDDHRYNNDGDGGYGRTDSYHAGYYNNSDNYRGAAGAAGEDSVNNRDDGKLSHDHDNPHGGGYPRSYSYDKNNYDDHKRRRY